MVWEWEPWEWEDGDSVIHLLNNIKLKIDKVRPNEFLYENNII